MAPHSLSFTISISGRLTQTASVEADEVFVPESFKGRRHLVRLARHHGGTGHGHVPLVPALIALEQYGREGDAVLLDKSLSQIEPELKPLLAPGSVLCTDGNPSYISVAEDVHGIVHKYMIYIDKCYVEDEVLRKISRSLSRFYSEI